MTDPASPSDWTTFIRTNTRLLTPPLVPEIKLHLAEESLPIWRRTEEELGAMNMPPPYWAFAWAGGQALARYILDTVDLVRRKSVLDLGAGSGLAAIAAKRAGATRVLAAEIDRVAIEAIALNAEANGQEIETTSDDLLGSSTDQRGFDIILVGDLFYERELANRVLSLIDRASRAKTQVLVGDPQRSYFPKERFSVAAEYRVPVTRELEDAEIKHTSVWTWKL